MYNIVCMCHTGLNTFFLWSNTENGPDRESSSCACAVLLYITTHFGKIVHDRWSSHFMMHQMFVQLYISFRNILHHHHSYKRYAVNNVIMKRYTLTPQHNYLMNINVALISPCLARTYKDFAKHLELKSLFTLGILIIIILNLMKTQTRF